MSVASQLIVRQLSVCGGRAAAETAAASSSVGEKRNRSKSREVRSREISKSCSLKMADAEVQRALFASFARAPPAAAAPASSYARSTFLDHEAKSGRALAERQTYGRRNDLVREGALVSRDGGRWGGSSAEKSPRAPAAGGGGRRRGSCEGTLQVLCLCGRVQSRVVVLTAGWVCLYGSGMVSVCRMQRPAWQRLVSANEPHAQGQVGSMRGADGGRR